MMNPSSAETTVIITFVVRFWRELSADKIRWRGRVEHVESGQQQSFLEIEDLLGFFGHFGINVKAAPGNSTKEDGEPNPRL